MYQTVLDFWFREIEPAMWWKKDLNFDLLIQERFGHLHQQAAAGELFAWRTTAAGSLAEVLLLDQFSRNIYRDKPQSFACDPMALALSQVAIAKGLDQAVAPVERSFFYLPWMHSESLTIHTKALKLFTALDNSNTLSFELKHKEIIEKFGRYPHRNKILGRESSAAELAFLSEPNSSF